MLGIRIIVSKDVKMKDCSIDGYEQGVEIEDSEGIKVKNIVIKSIKLHKVRITLLFLMILYALINFFTRITDVLLGIISW